MFPGRLLSASRARFRGPHREAIWNRADSNPRTGWVTPERIVWRVEIAPGLVRVASSDPARAERARERARRLQEVQVNQDAQDILEGRERVEAAPSRFIYAWSAASRRRLVETICQLDLSPIVRRDRLPAMVTLTLPGDWRAVGGTPKQGFRAFRRFQTAWRDTWGEPLRCIWKREFQRRGAPHWHLWVTPPVKMRRVHEFRAWLSATWTRCLFGARAFNAHERSGCFDLQDCELCKSRAAGTGLDFNEGLRARDPKRLAVYFLKESLGGEGKAYQNEAPDEWRGESVGRFWGVLGLDKAVAVVEVEPDEALQIARVLRGWARSAGVTREVEVWRLPRRGSPGWRRARRTGEVTRRRLRRPVKRMCGSAGWLAVNDGPSIAATLAKLLGPGAGRSAASVKLDALLGRQ